MEDNIILINRFLELEEKGSLLLRTVWDTLRHGLTDSQRECLEEAGKDFADALAKLEGRS